MTDQNWTKEKLFQEMEITSESVFDSQKSDPFTESAEIELDPESLVQAVRTSTKPEEEVFETTQSIHLDDLFTADVTSTGSFTFGGVDQTWFGKMIQALPIPALLVEESLHIIFVNEACSRVSPDYEALLGKKFSAIFPNPWIGREAQSAAERVFSTRRRESMQAVLEIERCKMWGRLYLRSIRLGQSRSMLVLVEDLTLEKEQLILKQRHAEEILRERNALEHRVEERTAELVRANERLKREISDRQKAEEAVRDKDARYRLLVENSPVGIACCDMQGNVTDLNPAALEILGAPSGEDTERMNILTSASPLDANASNCIRNCLKTGEPDVGEFPHRSKWGRQIFTRLNVAPIRDSGGLIIGAQIVLEDISDRRRAEGLLLRSERLKALVEMAGGVANNFNSSLQLISADVQMALTCLESRNFSELKNMLDQIRKTSHNAAQTVGRLDQFARVRSSNAMAKVFDLSEAVREGVEMGRVWWKSNPEQEGVRIDLDADLAQDCRVEGDHDEIVDVTVNLVKNAVEALPGGGSISIKTFVEGDQAVLQIKDDGIGIPKRNVGKMFEPFWTTKVSHAGMGLAVSLGIIRRHRGSVTVTSRERLGATIVVKLPMSGRPAGSADAGDAREASGLLQILMIGADTKASAELRSELEEMGHEVHTVASGDEALDYVKSQPISAALCGLSTLETSGWDVCRKMAGMFTDRGLVKPPMILLSDDASQLAEDQIVSHPEVDRVVQAPVEAAKLVEIILEEMRRADAPEVFSGSIYGVDIIEYVQLLLLSGQQAVVEIVSRGNERGLMFVDCGEIRHAVCGDTQGEEAIYRCLSFRGGNFSSHPWREPEKATVSKPGQFLLFEAARRRDEMRYEAKTKLF